MEAKKETDSTKQADNGKAEFDKLLATPMTKEEAEQLYANTEIEKAQLLGARNELSAQILSVELQISSIDAKLRIIDLRRAIASRRVLVKNEGKAENADA